MKFKSEDGKYTVIAHRDGTMEALRYDKPWRELTGDNMVYTMLSRIEELEVLEREVMGLVGAVAHIGVDFGFGEYELEDKYIKKAREIYGGWE